MSRLRTLRVHRHLCRLKTGHPADGWSLANTGDHLQTLHDHAADLLKELSSSWTNCEECTGTVQFHYVPRNSNADADALANQAISNPDPMIHCHDWPINDLLRLIHELTCTTCVKRAHAEAEAASTAIPGSKSRLSRNRRNRRRYCTRHNAHSAQHQSNVAQVNPKVKVKVKCAQERSAAHRIHGHFIACLIPNFALSAKIKKSAMNSTHQHSV